MATAATTDSPRATQAVDSSIPSVLAVIATHNGRAWLKDCLVGLNTQTYPLLDVLIVDDAGTETSKSVLRRFVKRHLRRRRWGFLRTPRALGFGGAINWALSRVKTDADLLLFIHDDAALDPDAVENMVARLLADDTTAIVGPKIVDWVNPSLLEEVGMAADRFGYPYKGLDDDEIDLGQHDASVEVFYVTSTCVLMRHDVFRQLRGWDSKMKVFAEDLDLCWRARVAGWAVRVEPRARARHAIAMATGQRRTRFTQTRYYIRRNRLRAVAKSASGLRLVALLPQFLVLYVAEMLGFILLRQPGEILNLLRALGWNVVASPQTLSERARVQRARKVPDYRLRKFTVRQSTRLRSYIGHQAERLEAAWGRRAEVLAQRSNDVRAIGQRLRGWAGVVVALSAIALLLGFRGFLFSAPAAVGDLLPYPDRVTGLLRTFVSPWQGVGLGQPGPTSPAFAILGMFPIITLGAMGAAQKLLVVTLGLIAFIGGYRLVGEVIDRPSRVVAGLVYALGSVGYAGLQHGDLPALVFGAAAPFVLHDMLRLSGWMRPPGWSRGRAVARLGLAAGVSAAFLPGTLFLYAIAAVALSACRALLEPSAKALRGLWPSLIGLVLGWLLVLPWSATWWAQDGGLHQLWSAESWRAYASRFHEHGMASVLLGQTPDAPALFGLALPLLGLIAVLVGSGQRRRAAVALWAVVLVTGAAVTAFSAGWIRPVVATPTEAGVIASAAFAALAGLAVGSFRLDLPQRGLGLVHAVTIAGIAAAGFLIFAGVLPALWHGEWEPAHGAGRVVTEDEAQIRSVLTTEAANLGQFRALWVGERWSHGETSSSRRPADFFVTGPRGEDLGDLFEREQQPGRAQMATVVRSVRDGSTDRAGRLLGAFNVRYVLVQRGPGAFRWLSQKDLSLAQTQDRYLIMHNDATLGRAALYNSLPLYVRALNEGDPALTAARPEIQRHDIPQRSTSSYALEDAAGPGTVFLAENADERWVATVDGAELERTAGGWGNAWRIPEGLRGALRVGYPRPLSSLLWLLYFGIIWTVVLGAAFSRRRRPAGRRSLR
jgi:GT2 family glycosyltransferase